MNDQPDRFQRARGTVYRWVGGDALLAAPDRDNFELLTGAGSTVWHLLALPRTLPELLEMTAETYEMPVAAIAADVEALVGELIVRGLIEEVIEVDS